MAANSTTPPPGINAVGSGPLPALLYRGNWTNFGRIPGAPDWHELFYHSDGEDILTQVGKQNKRKLARLLSGEVSSDTFRHTNKDGKTALMLASSKGCTKMVEMLVNAGWDVNYQNSSGMTALMWASCRVTSDALMKRGANVNLRNKDGNTALIYAAMCDDTSSFLVWGLLEEGADRNVQNNEGYTALMMAARWGYSSNVGELLKRGADRNLRNMNGATALMLAAENGHLNVVRMLLEGGAEKNLQSNKGETALTTAVVYGRLEVVRLLLQFGADKDSQDKDGCRALTMAAARDYLEIVKVLLEHGADKNVQDKHGRTALMIAAERGHLEIVRALLQYGADQDLQDEHGKTASSLAMTWQIKILISTHASSWWNWSRQSKLASTPARDVAPTRTSVKETTAAAELNHSPECAELHSECDTLGEQVAKAPARRDAMQRRDTLRVQLNAAKGNYEQISTLGESLEALKLEAAQLPLSEEDYLTLAARQAALVKKVKAKCDALLKEKRPDVLESMAAKLTVLQDLPNNWTFGANPVAEAAIKPHDPTKLQRLQTECTTFTQQLAHAPARRDLMQRRDELAARLNAVTTASTVDYALASKIMKEEQVLEEESAKLPLSEKDYKAMGNRHAALVQQVQDMCEDLVAARQYRLLRDLAAQLTALRVLDLSVLQDPSATDPVWVDEAAADPVHAARAPDTADKSPAPPRAIPVDGDVAGDKTRDAAAEVRAKKSSEKEKCLIM